MTWCSSSTSCSGCNWCEVRDALQDCAVDILATWLRFGWDLGLERGVDPLWKRPSLILLKSSFLALTFLSCAARWDDTSSSFFCPTKIRLAATPPLFPTRLPTPVATFEVATEQSKGIKCECKNTTRCTEAKLTAAIFLYSLPSAVSHSFSHLAPDAFSCVATAYRSLKLPFGISAQGLLYKRSTGMGARVTEFML